MEQKKINTKPCNYTPKSYLVIKSPIEPRSLCVAVGTEIKIPGFTFLCVEQDENTPTFGDGEHTNVLCAGCAAPWTLCHIMRCESSQRPDKRNVYFKVIARHE